MPRAEYQKTNQRQTQIKGDCQYRGKRGHRERECHSKEKVQAQQEM